MGCGATARPCGGAAEITNKVSIRKTEAASKADVGAREELVKVDEGTLESRIKLDIHGVRRISSPIPYP